MNGSFSRSSYLRSTAYNVLSLCCDASDDGAEGLQLCAGRLFGRENVGKGAFQTLQDLLKATQGDALFAHFQSMEGGRGESNLARELRVGQIAAFPAQERSQLFFQGLSHARTLPKNSSHLRDISALDYLW
jgi:hypothetical protein